MFLLLGYCDALRKMIVLYYVYDWILENFRYTSLDFTVFELVQRILFYADMERGRGCLFFIIYQLIANCILHLFHLIVFGFITLLGLDST